MELIKIQQTVIGNGAVNSVNSREIHSFVESKQQYADWIKSRLDDLSSIENEDFTIHKIMNGKNWQSDYIVTLEIAKHLAMMERNEKGKEARQYFIEYEKSTNELLNDPFIQLRIYQINQQKQIDSMALKLQSIEDKQIEAEKELLSLPAPTIEAKELTTRSKLNMLVRDYAIKTNQSFNDVWKNLYKELKYRHHFDVSVRAQNSKRSKLDIVDSFGLMEELYAIAYEVTK